jgi:hypothetical protein
MEVAKAAEVERVVVVELAADKSALTRTKVRLTQCKSQTIGTPKPAGF